MKLWFEGECVRRTDFWSNESGSAVIERAILACVAALVIVSLIASGLTPAELLQRAALLTDALIATGERPWTPRLPDE